MEIFKKNKTNNKKTKQNKPKNFKVDGLITSVITAK